MSPRRPHSHDIESIDGFRARVSRTGSGSAATRWLLIVLMVLLPAQFSWAAAAPYCAHERDPVAFHVGHHAHVHAGSPTEAQQASPAPENETPTSLAALDHGDCHGCHGAAGHPASAAASSVAPPARQMHIGVATARLEDGRAPSIERPQWTRAA